MGFNFNLVVIVVCIVIKLSSGLLTMTLQERRPQLFLISGSTGTLKTTFGMEIALSRGISTCMSTNNIRQIVRSYDNHPAVHRSSYSGYGDAVLQWRETCKVLAQPMESMIDDCMRRGTSLVLEGVHIYPSNRIIRRWVEQGGVAMGVVLTISDSEAHRSVIRRRHGERATMESNDQLNNFDRIRLIQNEMVRLAKLKKWLIIEQSPVFDPQPIELLSREIQQTRDIQTPVWVAKPPSPNYFT